MRTCSYCGGRGAIERTVPVGSGDYRTTVVVNEACPICSGSGRESQAVAVIDEEDPRSLWEQAKERIERGRPL